LIYLPRCYLEWI